MTTKLSEPQASLLWSLIAFGPKATHQVKTNTAKSLERRGYVMQRWTDRQGVIYKVTPAGAVAFVRQEGRLPSAGIDPSTIATALEEAYREAHDRETAALLAAAEVAEAAAALEPAPAPAPAAIAHNDQVTIPGKVGIHRVIRLDTPREFALVAPLHATRLSEASWHRTGYLIKVAAPAPVTVAQAQEAAEFIGADEAALILGLGGLSGADPAALGRLVARAAELADQDCDKHAGHKRKGCKPCADYIENYWRPQMAGRVVDIEQAYEQARLINALLSAPAPYTPTWAAGIGGWIDPTVLGDGTVPAEAFDVRLGVEVRTHAGRAGNEHHGRVVAFINDNTEVIIDTDKGKLHRALVNLVVWPFTYTGGRCGWHEDGLPCNRQAREAIGWRQRPKGAPSVARTTLVCGRHYPEAYRALQPFLSARTLPTNAMPTWLTGRMVDCMECGATRDAATMLAVGSGDYRCWIVNGAGTHDMVCPAPAAPAPAPALEPAAPRVATHHDGDPDGCSADCTGPHLGDAPEGHVCGGCGGRCYPVCLHQARPYEAHEGRTGAAEMADSDY